MAATGVRPYYVPVGNEELVFIAAFRQGLSIVLKGPTGCGKTRFVEAMAHDLERPLITVACHDHLTTADLVGRFLLQGGETEWVDGPLTRAVREGAICYLDEVVEARQDTVSASLSPTTPATRVCLRISKIRPIIEWLRLNSVSLQRLSRKRS
jgi:nitric oxide reductase NorQ protein